jgi:hypothetical protein
MAAAGHDPEAVPCLQAKQALLVPVWARSSGRRGSESGLSVRWRATITPLGGEGGGLESGGGEPRDGGEAGALETS